MNQRTEVPRAAKYELSTIGGMFGDADHRRFERNDNDSQFDQFFPCRIRDTRRCFYETGIDAVAAILNECQTERRSIRFWTAENFCGESLQRLHIKLRNPIEFHRYRSINDFRQLGSKDVVLYLHFNCYNPTSGHVIDGIRKQAGAIVIEDFVQAPLDIARFTGDFAMNSLRKFSSLDLAVSYQKNPNSASTAETAYWRSRKAAESARSRFLDNPTEELEQIHLRLYRESETALHVPVISAAHPAEIGRGRRFDFQTVHRIRKENYTRLSESLRRDWPDVTILPGDYMYLMIETANRARLRSELFARRIFPAIHWADSQCQLADSLLSFHIDQRYCQSDMDRVCTAITEIRRER